MFNREDNTYNEIREKSLFQWLDEMEKHEDIAVRGGVKLTRQYSLDFYAQIGAFVSFELIHIVIILLGGIALFLFGCKMDNIV